MLFSIQQLHVSVGDTPILKGIDLSIGAGEVHAVMGPNGSGKSTLTKAIAGYPGYDVCGGDMLFEGESILAMSAEERALKGIFLSFQYPVEIPGVNNGYFLRLAYNAKQRFLGLEEIDPMDFDDLIQHKLTELKMDPQFLDRDLNAGFSGGEKKRNELLQMAVLEPKLAILDEIDSGLDIDALRIVAEGIHQLRRPDRAILLITHYQRLLDYIEPDYVHVFSDGRFILSGGKELAHELEAKGYDWVIAK